MPHILVIEDEYLIRENLVETLVYNGYEVAEAEDGVEGIEVLRRIKPDIIVCDIMMGEVGGFDVLEVVRDELGLIDVPFVFLTAVVDKKAQALAAQYGVDAFIKKPFSSMELLTVIRQLLNQVQH